MNLTSFVNKHVVPAATKVDAAVAYGVPATKAAAADKVAKFTTWIGDKAAASFEAANKAADAAREQFNAAFPEAVDRRPGEDEVAALARKMGVSSSALRGALQIVNEQLAAKN